MATFSATDAAFEGFRLTKEQPKTLLVWAGFNLIVSVIGLVVFVGLGGSALQALTEMDAAGNSDPAQAMASLGQLGPAYLLLMVVSIVTQAMLGAAVYRAILRPQDGGLGYLKLGGDELRLIGLSLIYFCLFVVGTFVLVLVAGLIGALTAQLLGQAGGALLGVGIGLFVLGLMVFVIVRLSLAGVVTFARRRISVFGSWELTRGNFWLMLGAYVLTLVSVVVIALLAVIVFAAVTAIATGGDLAAAGAVFRPDTSSLGAYLTPATIIYTVFGAAVNAVYYAAMFAPHAVIYRSLSGDAEASAEVFA